MAGVADTETVDSFAEDAAGQVLAFMVEIRGWGANRAQLRAKINTATRIETNTLVRWVAFALLTAIASGCGGSQTEPRAPHMGSSNSDYHLASNAPQDRLLGATPSTLDQLEQMTAPLVRQARETYPDAKRRFLKGLPPGQVFFVTVRLHDEKGRFEQVFVHVEHIIGDVIAGSLASDINLVGHYKSGDHFEMKEAELVDWLISKPDGSEEGNLVGKYLDKLQEQGSANPQ